MTHYRRFIYRKPPDGLLEISERVFEIMEENQFKTYVEGIIGQLQEYIPDASYMAFNICEGDYQTLLDKILSNFGVTIINYPRQYKNCPVLTVEMIHHFLRTSENWLSLGQRNVLLMHCERGGWPVLAFMLAGLLIYQKQYNAEQRTLDMIYRQAPRELLNLVCPLNPLPSQLRYLQYIFRRNVGTVWPPVDRSLILDCVILRMIPDIDGSGGCRPIFRIYGRNPLTATDRSSKLLFSTPKERKLVRRLNQAQYELVKIDINCHVQGDVVLECITLDDDLIEEKMMFRVMFNTALIRSNILMLNRDEIDILWNVKEQFPNGFRFEIIFSDLDSASSMRTQSLPVAWDKAGLPMEAFSKVQEIFSNVDFICSKPDVALDIIHNLAASSIPKKVDVVSSTKRQLSDSDLVHKAKDLEQLESISQKGAKEARVAEGLSMGGTKGMTKSVEEMVKHAESGKDVSGPSVEIELEVLQVDSQRSSEQEEDSTKEVGNLEDVSPQIFSKKLAGGFSSQVTGGKKSNILLNEMAKEILVTQNISEAGAEVMSNYVDTDRGSRSSVANIQELFSTKSAKETACLQNITVAKTEESDRVSKSSAAEIQETPAYLQILAEASDKQVDISTAKGESETKPIQNMNIAETEEMSEPVELKRGSSCSTAEVEEQQLAAQKSAESRLASGTSPKGSMSNPTSYCKSLQGSPVPLSRYHSAPSDLGISALLNDHFAPDIKGLNAVTLSQRHAISPSFPLSDKDMLCSIGSTMRKSPTPHLKEIRSEAMNIPQSPVTPHSQTPPGKVTPPSSPPEPMPSTLAPKLNDSSPRAPPPPPPPPPYAMSSTKAMSSFMLRENSPAIPQLPLSLPGSGLATNCSCSSSVPVPPSPQSFARQGAQLAAPTSSVPAPPSPQPAVIEKHFVRDITPDFPPESSRVPKPPPSPPSPPPHLMLKESMPVINQHSPRVPPLPASSLLPKSGSSFTSPPTPPLGAKGRMPPRSTPRNQLQSKKSNLKPYHWLKLTRAVQGSLWAEAQKPEEASQTPEIDMSELENLFAASVPNSDRPSTLQRSTSRTLGPKSEKVNLIELRRAYNCEIMLTKVKVPLHELTTSIMTLDDSSLDVDQVENLSKFCPKKEEIDLLKNYKGDETNLGKCEQFFLELMKVPRVESKLRVFAFKIQFHSQVSDLKKDLNVINSACEEVRNSVKLKRIMQTILSLGNALNQGTARGSAVGFRLDSLLKLTDTRSRNNKMTLMHYLCKVLSEKLPELLNFPEDLLNLEAATKIQLKYLAEEMQAISRGLEKVIQELTLSENDGSVSDSFCKALMKFLPLAEGEVRSLASLYAAVGRDADALSLYFGEDPARVPFEQVVSTLHNFVRMFIRAHDENCKQIELEKKKAQKEADEKAKLDSSENQKVTITSNLQDHLVK